MAERVTAWQCIGCGRIEGAQPCIGICEDRRTEFVYAAEYDAAIARLERSRQQAEALAVVVRQIAHTTPREHECEPTWRALQARAREVLLTLGENPQARGK